VFNFFDFICAVSIVGIYPRYIEPNLIGVTQLQYFTKYKSLDGLRIVQISDLHFPLPSHFLDRISKKILAKKPDLIAITGDFIQYSQIKQPDLLKSFLSSLKAPLGCFAVLGNHDYSDYIGIGPQRCYEVRQPVAPARQLKNRLIKKVKKPSASFAFSLKNIVPHRELVQLLQESGVHLLHNQRLDLRADLRIHGVGEYWAADCDERIVEDTDQFSLLLIHNPDGFKLFKEKKIDLALSGHIHSGQVNLPGIRRLFLVNEEGYVKGLYNHLYVNRGLGGTLPLRMCAIPEITLFELKYG
jgi:predicted MPP superfamily phosphohydrolase